jgi:hypothetical protein
MISQFWKIGREGAMDLPILKYLDVFIGVALVMLLGCSVVGAVTHVINGILRLRVKIYSRG